ncbi:MAG: Dam family site-specific DNA-(adenine-N6)-methyltransferase [Phycisphaerae bacterium]|nr:Dam family site-specific DNA-(adenine-N6)-methyltransferase [Phycisphaerae bacterium]
MHKIDTDDIFGRAKRPNSAIPRPFLRWAGSKRRLLSHLTEFLPPSFKTYFEPFLGSGALFFLLQADNAVLSDSCAELIDTFCAVRDNVSAVLRYLNPLKPNKALYYRIRESRSAGQFRRAAEFIYLNKTCWNGLYRVNSQGNFNVPYGLHRSDNISDVVNLRACAEALRKRTIRLSPSDFEEAVALAAAGDLVYLDPPYVTGHTNNAFIDYNNVLFSWKDQQRLAAVAEELRRRGAHVIVNNANHPAVRKLYRSFRKVSFSRYSTLASDASKRHLVREMLLVTDV